MRQTIIWLALLPFIVFTVCAYGVLLILDGDGIP